MTCLAPSVTVPLSVGLTTEIVDNNNLQLLTVIELTVIQSYYIVL